MFVHSMLLGTADLEQDVETHTSVRPGLMRPDGHTQKPRKERQRVKRRGQREMAKVRRVRRETLRLRKVALELRQLLLRRHPPLRSLRSKGNKPKRHGNPFASSVTKPFLL